MLTSETLIDVLGLAIRTRCTCVVWGQSSLAKDSSDVAAVSPLKRVDSPTLCLKLFRSLIRKTFQSGKSGTE